jgi:hypothetical protein
MARRQRLRPATARRSASAAGATKLPAPISKKLANHEAAVALHFMHYDFVRIHQSLRVTPAMAAGVTDRLWSIEDIAALLD